MILTALEVARLAQSAGFTGASIVTITAIAHAESGFNTEAIGDVALETNIWGPSVGLWQIRTLHHNPPSFRDYNLLTDPVSGPMNQAIAAYMISAKGINFTPWSTFTNGAYKQFLPEAIAAYNQLTIGKEPSMSTIVAFSPTPTGKGYWIVFSDGAVFGFGDAEYHGRPQVVNGIWEPVK